MGSKSCTSSVFLLLLGDEIHPEDLAELIDVIGASYRFFDRDETALYQAGQGLVEGHHAALLLTDLHDSIDLVDLVLTYEVSDARVWNQDLRGANPPGSGRLR